MPAAAEIAPSNRLQRRSELRADADAVWSAAVDPAGINDEMRPWARMTMPRRLRGRSIDELPIGSTAGRSWLLLFGLIPVDYDDLCLVAVEPPRRFLERSRMSTLAIWEHERLVEPLPGAVGGCSVTDRLGFVLKPLPARIPGSASLARAIIGSFFTHRHRRLRRRDTARGI